MLPQESSPLAAHVMGYRYFMSVPRVLSRWRLIHRQQDSARPKGWNETREKPRSAMMHLLLSIGKCKARQLTSRFLRKVNGYLQRNSLSVHQRAAENSSMKASTSSEMCLNLEIDPTENQISLYISHQLPLSCLRRGGQGLLPYPYFEPQRHVIMRMPINSRQSY